MYCVIKNDGEAIVVSHSMRGAKQIATRNGYPKVGRISTINNMVYGIETKVEGKWIKE